VSEKNQLLTPNIQISGIDSLPEPIIRLYASGVGRNFKNYSSPLSIVGASSNLCVSVSRFAPLPVDCKTDTKEQQWGSGTDGTVRTEMTFSFSHAASVRLVI